MEDYRLILDLVIALGAALIGGSIAQRIGQPVLIGYIVAGIIIGPNTPGLVAEHANVETLAFLGVAFLMFSIGVEVSFSELHGLRRVALITGGVQVPLTIVIGFGAALAIGWSWQAAVLLGSAFAISSTIVALKLLAARGELVSPHGRAALSIGIVQDVCLVPIIAMLPVLSGESEDLAASLLKSLATAAVALVLVLVVGTRLAPRIFHAVARTNSRELFLVLIVLIALGTALASEWAGLSIALGAFLAGLMVSESGFDTQVISEVIPLRDLFASLFFVSVGMLLDPNYVVHHAGVIALLLAIVVIAKLLLIGGALLATGLNYRTATICAVLMAQMGEFSFVLAGLGLADHIIADDQYALILAVALGSILLSPILLAATPALVSLSQHLPGVRQKAAVEVGVEPEPADFSAHVVLCGYGRVGQVLGDVLADQEFPYTVIEIDQVTTRELRDRGVVAFYGDAGSDELLIRAGIREAHVLVVTISDLMSARSAITRARHLNPDLTIITRAVSRNEVRVLREAGANEVIQPEFEAGLECADHMLRTLGMPDAAVRSIVTSYRFALYLDDDSLLKNA